MKIITLLKQIPLVCLLLIMLPWQQASAHFQLNINIRVVHVEHTRDGVRLYMRLPTPYLLADKLGTAGEDGLPEAAPYSYNRIDNGELFHYVDYAQLAADPAGLGQLVADGHQLSGPDGTLTPQVEAVRLYNQQQQPPFASLEEARLAFSKPQQAVPESEVYVGDTVTDVQLFYPASSTLYDYGFSSSLNPGLDNQQETANLILDYFPGGTQIFRAKGLLEEPVVVSRSAWAAAWTFLVSGVEHIVTGYDHILFVVCLIIGATGTASLLWRVTGFTLGHSVTLIVGFFGWVPAAAWFIPSVETGIALSIIFAAVLALRPDDKHGSFWMTAAIGLLHGLGFSFLLREFLQIDSPNLWQSLLAFNAGVEVGQLGIVLLLWPLVWYTRSYQPQLNTRMTWAIALPCIAIAGIWTGERLVQLADTLI